MSESASTNVATSDDLTFEGVVAALNRGDFSWLAPLYDEPLEGSRLARWVEDDRFADDAAALNEAATCACFLGRTAWVTYLLDRGGDPIAGNGTGLNGFHWATNRGQLETTRALIARRLPMEIRNSYGGTVLGGAVWAAVNEPRATHPAIVEALLEAGADVRDAAYPSGSEAIDAILRRFGAGGAPGSSARPEPTDDVANYGLIRPPIVFLASIALGLIIHRFWPAPLLPSPLNVAIGVVLLLVAISLFVSAARTFREAETPVPGNRPTTTIVRTGPYRFTRNPIYLAFTLFQLGLAAWINSLGLVITLLPAVALMAFVVIPREESYLEGRFPEEYPPYRRAVRRWL